MTAQPGNQPAPGDTLHIGVSRHAGRYRVREKLGQGGNTPTGSERHSMYTVVIQ